MGGQENTYGNTGVTRGGVLEAMIATQIRTTTAVDVTKPAMARSVTRLYSTQGSVQTLARCESHTYMA